jgi:hypothetical protein
MSADRVEYWNSNSFFFSHLLFVQFETAFMKGSAAFCQFVDPFL